MNKLSLRQTIVLFALFFLSISCSEFLEEEPYSILTEEEVFGNEDNLQLLISGLYTQWRNTRQDRGSLLIELGTDGAKQGGQQVQENNEQAALDKYGGALEPANSTIAGLWNQRWPILSNAAKAVYYAPTDELKGEASFLRAALAYELAMFWGPIPIIDLDNMRETRQPLTDVFSFIIEDLEFASTNLPEDQDDKNLPTKYAAKALLGKVYLSAPEETGLRDYEMAVACFDDVIPHFSLLDNYNDLFDTRLNQNTSEVIYAFQFTNKQPDNNMVQHHAGSRAAADLDDRTYFGGYDLALPTKYYYNDIWIGYERDSRREASIRYDFTLPDGRQPKITWTGQSDELEPHSRKFEDIRTQGEQNFWYSGGLIYYLRLADVILSKAEALNELGKTTEAIDLVNSTVRNRAFRGEIREDEKWKGFSQEEFRDQIMDERMRELGFEGWRRIDLIRTGKFVEYIKERNPWAKESGAIQDFHMWYPIPETEIRQNDNINFEDQNPGY